jgi:hypothetical protein
MGVEPGEGDAQNKEKEGRPNGGFDEDLRGLRAPNRFRKASAESRSEALLLAALHHDDKPHEGAIDHVKEKQNINGGIRPKRIRPHKGR